jgi:hypothetical protein
VSTPASISDYFFGGVVTGSTANATPRVGARSAHVKPWDRAPIAAVTE